MDICSATGMQSINSMFYYFLTILKQCLITYCGWLVVQKRHSCVSVSDKHRSYLLYAEGKKKIFKCQRKPCRCMTHHINLDVTAHDLFN